MACAVWCPRPLYLAGTLGAAVHDPILLVLEQTAVLPAHVLLLCVLHPHQSLLHQRVLLRLGGDDTEISTRTLSQSKGPITRPKRFSMVLTE